MQDVKTFSLFLTAGGALRIASSFIPYSPGNDVLELFYMVIDLAFILGLVGLYLTYGIRIGTAGRIAVAIMLCGFAVIAGPEAPLFDIPIYQLGSSVVGLGSVLFAVALLRCHVGPIHVPVLLITAFAAGLCSMALHQPLLFTVSGVLFGAGFALLGLHDFFSAGHRHPD